MGWCGLDSSGSGYGQVESCCDCGNEPSGGYTVGGLALSSTGLVN
jgi:hypothetical protein